MSGWKITGTSLGAIIASLATLGCCLPLPFIGAAGVAGASVLIAGARPWLLGFSILLLGAGFFQIYRGVRCRARQSKTAIALLGLSTVILILLLLFPQFLASVLANISGAGH